MIKGIFLGVLGAVLTAVVAGYIFMSLGLMPANADAEPGSLETWIAKKSLRAALNRVVLPKTNPLPANEANLKAGIKLYTENCLVCHGASDGQASNIARGLFQKAPQFAKHGVEDDAEEKIYWLIQHGLRMTGMPSYGAALTENQIWQITMFLKNMDALPPQADKVWKALPSAASSSLYHDH